MIRKIACEIWKLLYRPALSNEKADSMGHNAASHLAHYVTQLMVDRAEGKNKLRLAAYSAHDTTILALAARLGIDIEPPEFGGYFLFELHCDAVDPDTPYVKFFYNSEPTVIPCVRSCRRLGVGGRRPLIRSTLSVRCRPPLLDDRIGC